MAQAEMTAPEFTMRAVLWGTFFCIVFTIASAYSTLKVGQGMEAAIPISILAIGLARMYSRRSTLLENVIIIGMGGASAAVVAGAVFTLPALYSLHLSPHLSLSDILQMLLRSTRWSIECANLLSRVSKRLL